MCYILSPFYNTVRHMIHFFVSVDVRVPFFFEFVWQGLMYILLQLVVVCVILPVFLVALLVIFGKLLYVFDTFKNLTSF